MKTKLTQYLLAALLGAAFTVSIQAQSPYKNWFRSLTITNPTPEAYDDFGGWAAVNRIPDCGA